jgi:hypothetical protein
MNAPESRDALLSTEDGNPAHRPSEQFSNFGYLALSKFCATHDSQILRAQSADLTRLMDAVRTRIAEDLTKSDHAQVAAAGVTNLTRLLAAHKTLVDGLVTRRLSADQQSRVLAENFERDMKPVLANVHALHRRFGSPSAIKAKPEAFASEAEGVFRALESRLQQQDLELFSRYDALVKTT